MDKAAYTDGEFNKNSYYTLGEFCKKIGIPKKTIRTKYITTGLLRVSVIARGYEVIPGYEVFRFFDERFGGDDVA